VFRSICRDDINMERRDFLKTVIGAAVGAVVLPKITMVMVKVSSVILLFLAVLWWKFLLDALDDRPTVHTNGASTLFVFTRFAVAVFAHLVCSVQG